MKSHDKFHEKQLKSSMEKGLQKKSNPYAEKIKAGFYMPGFSI